MQTVWKNVKAWIKENSLILLYFLFAVIIEMTAVFVVEGNPFLTRPFLSLGLLVLICGALLFIKSHRARVIVCAVLLGLQLVLELVFSVIFDMTDQYFDLGMLNLRNDAFAILENLPVNFITFFVGLFLFVMFLVFGLRFAYYHEPPKRGKKSIFFYVGLVLAGVATMGISFVSYYPRNAKNKYDEMVLGKASSNYSAYGMIGNLVGEFGNAVFQDRTPLADDDIDNFVYGSNSKAQHTPYFGVSKDKNVVVILAESLEWYLFLQSQNESSLNGEYVNTLNIPQEDLIKLYPNLNEYYKESVAVTNFHGREKTDIAETLSIIGSYPTGTYVNYEYAENTIPYTLPNILKLQTGGEISARSYHNGFKSFYNREEAHKAFGFEVLTDMYDMEAISNRLEKEGHEEIFHNYMDEGERNLDSEMIFTCKDEMFPKDRRFYTYITSITMHGMYYDRDNLSKENNVKLAEKITLLEKYKPMDETVENYENLQALYYYMTTGLEFDYMLGCMKEDLVAKGLWEDTVVVLFADHNTYYQGMSSFVKGIDDYETEKKFSDLYNIPLFIRDSDLLAKIEERGDSRVVDKFTCTADIVPTLLDMLGIEYFDNLYYGNSIFSASQSVLYSRAYDIFVGDGIVRRSVKSPFYLYNGNTEKGVPVKDTVAAFEEEGESLVEKIKYCDYIFRQDHFGKEEHYNRFREEMKKLNAWQ